VSAMYLVVRRALDRSGRACEDQSGNDTGSRVPLRMFVDRTAADAFVAGQIAEIRRTMNPFHIIGGFVDTDAQKQLERLELPVACPDDPWHEEWKVWWDLCQDLVSDEQRAAVWTILEADPPFDVIVLEVSDE
jgi:hypothetical protein